MFYTKSPEIYFLEIQLRFKTKMTKRQCINDPKTLVPSRKKGADEPKDGTVLKKKTVFDRSAGT